MRTIQDYKDQILNLGIKVRIAPDTASGTWGLYCPKHKIAFDKRMWEYPKKFLGCKKCVSERISESKVGKEAHNKRSHEDWVEKIRAKHPHLEVKSKILGSTCRIKLLCLTCKNRWESHPNNLLASVIGCPECAKGIMRSAQVKEAKTFASEIFEEFGRALTVVGNYKNDNTDIEILCNSCGFRFFRKPKALLLQKRQGVETTRNACPQCRKNSGCVSSASQKWLKEVEKRKRIKLEYATNGKERIIHIGKATYKVDGFHKRTNTVYEFYGDNWHGNPDTTVGSNFVHPKLKKYKTRESQASYLLASTGKRQLKLASAGYTVIYVWESDYASGKLFSGKLTPYI